MLEASHALQAAAFARRHVPALPRDDRDLACAHRHERRRRGWLLDANAGGSEAYDIFPNAALLPLHIPLKFLEARVKLPDAGQPFIDKLLMLLVESTVLPDKRDLPLGELPLF